MKIKLLVGTGAAVALIVAGIATWALWPRAAAGPQGSASRYLNASACLLTGPSGITPGTASAPVWTAMRSASQTTHVMVSYLPDTGRTDVTPMLNALVERHCGVIIATSDAGAAVTKAARANPRQSFLLVATLRALQALRTSSAAATSGPPNTVVVPAAHASARIDQALHVLAAHATQAGS